MSNQVNSLKKGLTVKDLVTTGIFSAIFFVFTLVGGLPFAPNPVLTFYMPMGAALLCGPIYLLMVAKVQKRWSVTILGIIMGIIWFATGMHWAFSLGYYDVLRQAQIGWHEGTEDVVPFIKYLLGIILSAYKDFEDRFALVDTKLPAMETVRRATMEKIGRFTKQDIRELCPSISISSIEGALRKLVASGELKREGAGKKICYYRLK